MINISELTQYHHKKQEENKKKYDKVLKDCHIDIKINAKNEKYNCWYKIPVFLWGIPAYDIRECTYYIMLKLTNNGFNVKLYPDRNLYISWEKYKPKEPEYIKKSKISNTPYINSIKPPAIMPKTQYIKQHIKNNYNTEIQRKKQLMDKYFLPSDNIPQIINKPIKRVVDLSYKKNDDNIPLISSRPIASRSSITREPIQENNSTKTKTKTTKSKSKNNYEIQFV